MSPVYRTGALTCLATGQLAASESNRAIPAHQTGPVDQLGRGQRKTEDSDPSAHAPGRVQTGGRTLAASSSRADDGGPDPPALSRPSRFEREAAVRHLHHPRRKTENSNPRRLPAPPGFRPGASIPLASSSRSGERTTRKPCPHGHDPASNRSRPLAGSLSLSTLPGTRTETPDV